ncbi:DinB family protein [Flavobacterium terrigena]|uniref:Uncharacterized damage-inducible protein DinB (Forms a four-helix bundle) n=1 Tax=Flavobacterium terrigena TaxID=402734 RepID=A0A1H6RTB6_9FLAO|nr:DinB family protein [Flavobacterium terrigena]SEI58993.1 Uncharacterized damage-inducible protein DinB (forms a four-helix bundle) [Flavobacterium terrigena]
MKDFYKDKFKYNLNINQKIIQNLLENKEKLNDRILTLISHTLNAHHIWNSRMLNTQIVHKVWDIYDYEKMISIDIENNDNSLKAIENFDLDESIDYVTMINEPFCNTRQDILYHILNHSNYHRAQINTELKNLGLNSITTDYIFYKRQ